MTELNLPHFDANISEKEGKKFIFDVLRRKNVVLTPEEWVRQNFVNFLTTVKSFPPERMANEVSINVNNTAKRCDTVVYDEYLKPLVVVEYKSPAVTVSRSVFNQIARYNSVLRVPYLIVSNGFTHYCCMINYNDMTFVFLPDIPSFAEILRTSKPD